MKKLIFTLLFFIYVIPAKSQFSINSFVGQGVKINNDLDYSIYQTSINIPLTYDFGKLKVSEINTSFITDSTTEYAIGFSPAYEVWRQNKKGIDINAMVMAGNYQKFYYGGGVNYLNDNLILGIQYLYESKFKESLIQGVIGFEIYKD